ERLQLRDRTAFIITGDHGSADVHSQLRPNLWLVEAGLLEARADRGDWRAAFFASGGSAFLKLRDPSDTQAASLARAVVESQPHALRSLFTIVDSAELARLGADPE